MAACNHIGMTFSRIMYLRDISQFGKKGVNCIIIHFCFGGSGGMMVLCGLCGVGAPWDKNSIRYLTHGVAHHHISPTAVHIIRI